MEGLESLLQQLVMASQDAIVIADRGGVIRYWNGGAERMFGFAADEAVGQSLDLIVPEKLRPRHWEGFNRVMASGESRYVTNLLSAPGMTKAGSSISLQFSMVLLRGSGGELLGCASIMRDVSDQWRREKELRERIKVCEAALASP